MDVLPKSALFCALAVSIPAGISVPLVAQPVATVQRVTALDSPDGVQVEITCNSPVTPQAQIVSNPDRLVIDFPQALPAGTLHNLQVRRGEVKDVRVGLFTARPPVTRVVLDLNRAQAYRLVPSGNRILVRVGGPQTMAERVMVPQSPPAPRVTVQFHNGLLSIQADRASLAEVLSEIQRRTGADIPIPAGAGQELVVVRQAPMPAEAALAALLYGSRFNFILVGSENNASGLQSAILTPKSGLPAGQMFTSSERMEPPIAETPAPVTPPAAGEEEPEEDDVPNEPPQPPQPN